MMRPHDVSREANKYSVGEGGALESGLVRGKEKRFWERVLGASWGRAVSVVCKQIGEWGR